MNKLFAKKRVTAGTGKTARILLLSDFSRKMIKEGKVPDVKLEVLLLSDVDDHQDCHCN